ncbi:MAG: SdpI family protein [Chitinophagaceae bacterium]|nr:SdpI family protein [Chitinophagaceae bacterium]
MKQSKLFQTLFPFIVMAIPWIYLSFIWKDLPQTIPTHFGIEGTADKFGNKNEIFLAPIVMTVVGIFMYFLLKNIYNIDPKKKYSATTSAIMSKIAIVVIVLLSAVTMFILFWTVKGKVEGMPAFFCGLSLFFAYLGNLMHSVKPNYFVGFRIPWALESEENWTKTHRLASKIWFTGGILLAIFSLLASIKVLIIVFISSVFIMTIIPVVYSYKIYRQSTKLTNEE